MRFLITAVCIALVVSVPGIAFAGSQTEEEVKQAVIEGNKYLNENLEGEPGSYSKLGAFEFWSSGGLLQKIPPDGRVGKFDSITIHVKHIKVLTLVEDQAAVAHFYAEGSMKPKGYPATTNYLTRVTQVFVKEDGEWRIRSSHWSPIIGGSGTTQTAEE
jgi:hypothetical protein